MTAKRGKALCLALLLAAGPAFADETKPPAMSPPDAWMPGHAATIRVLNKLDSTVQNLTLRAGESATIQTLKISMLACDVRPADLPQDATAHLAIEDSRAGTQPFDGWLLKNEPAVTMFEHPVYDVQLAGCA